MACFHILYALFFFFVGKSILFKYRNFLVVVGGRGSDSIMCSLVSVTFFGFLGLGCLSIYNLIPLIGQFLSIQISWDSLFPLRLHPDVRGFCYVSVLKMT